MEEVNLYRANKLSNSCSLNQIEVENTDIVILKICRTGVPIGKCPSIDFPVLMRGKHN